MGKDHSFYRCKPQYCYIRNVIPVDCYLGKPAYICNIKNSNIINISIIKYLIIRYLHNLIKVMIYIRMFYLQF